MSNGDAGADAFDVVIVGAGHAGAQAAIALRQLGFAGSLAIIGEEAHLPYERPPLSKDYLSQDKPFERLLIRPAAFWEQRRVTVLPGRRVEAIDPVSKTLRDAGGNEIRAGVLIWAAGGRPRSLACPGRDLAGVHTIRNRDDVDRLITELPGTRAVAVIGGGYIGLEAAAVLRKLGKTVTVLEAQDRVLARVAGEPLSRFYEASHRAHGVDLRLESTVDCLLEEPGQRVAGVRLSSGEEIAAQMVVVGIGIVPEVAPLLAAGAEPAAGGVLVDAQCRTTLKDVFAVGDCAACASPHASDAVLRIESVQNANDQATVAARTIMGLPAHYDALPWFWSNQYDLRLQTVGLSVGHDEVVTRGDPSTAGFSLIYVRDGRPVAADCVNSVKDYVQAKALILSGARPTRAQLADSAVPLKALALSS